MFIMVKLAILLIVVCLLVRGSISADHELKGLKLVHLLYRHGDRTPCGGYPTDPNSDPWRVAEAEV